MLQRRMKHRPSLDVIVFVSLYDPDLLYFWKSQSALNPLWTDRNHANTSKKPNHEQDASSDISIIASDTSPERWKSQQYGHPYAPKIAQ